LLFARWKRLTAVVAWLMALRFSTSAVSVRDVCGRILGSSGAFGFARSKGTHRGRPIVSNLVVHHGYVIPLGLDLMHCLVENVNWAGMALNQGPDAILE